MREVFQRYLNYERQTYQHLREDPTSPKLRAQMRDKAVQRLLVPRSHEFLSSQIQFPEKCRVERVEGGGWEKVKSTVQMGCGQVGHLQVENGHHYPHSLLPGRLGFRDTERGP